MLMLDRVGTSLSPNFSMLEKAVKLSANPILAGGGIKDIDDLFKAKDVGCEGVLISTAVHEGRVTLKTIRQGKI
jgi:phosphoribosylformimino-5-aminoimidazole carboxamide ribotide isomerase